MLECGCETVLYIPFVVKCLKIFFAAYAIKNM